MSDWRHSGPGYWSNQGSGHAPQYPDRVVEEEFEDEQDYADTGEGYTYAPTPDYQSQIDEQQQEAYWTDEPQTYTSNSQQYYQDQPYYQPLDGDQGEVTYTPTTYTGSMDVNFSEHGQDNNDQQESASPPPPPPAFNEDHPDDTREDRTHDFVTQRRGSYERHEEYRTAPATAQRRHVVDASQQIRDADRRARVRDRARARDRGGSGGSRSGGGGSSAGGGGGSGGGSSSSRGGGGGSGGKSSGGKGSSSKSGGRS